MTGTIRDDQYTFLIISRSVRSRMKNVSTNVVEKIETHILCSTTLFPQNHAVYEMMWKNTVERERPQMTIWRMPIAC